MRVTCCAAVRRGRVVEFSAADVQPDRMVTAGDWKVNNVTIQDRVVAPKGQQAAEETRDFIIDVTKAYTLQRAEPHVPRKQGKKESRAWMLDARRLMLPKAAAGWTRAVNTYFSDSSLC